MKQLVLAPDKQSLKSAINTKLAIFLDAFTSALFLTGMLVLVGLLLKFTHLPGEQVVFVVAMSLLTFLFLLQTGISFVFVFAHAKLAFLGAFSSLAIALSCMTLVFVYENWWGTYLMVLLTAPLSFITFLILVGYFLSGEHRHTTHRKFLYINILSPYLFISLLWLAFIIRHEVRENRERRVAWHAPLEIAGNPEKFTRYFNLQL